MATSKKTTSTKATKATTKAAKAEEAKEVLTDNDVEVIKPQPIVTEVKEKKTTKTTASKKTATKKSEATKDEAKAETTEDVKEDTTMENTNINVKDFDEEKFAMDVLESFNKFNTVLETMSNNITASQKEMNALQAKVDANEKNIKIISKYLADKEKSELEAEAETEAEAAEEGATEEGKKKWSTKKKVAVGVGIGVGVLAVAGVGYAIYKHNKDKNDYADIDSIVSINPPSDDDVDDVVVTEF